MVVQSALVITACHYGWGSAIASLPDSNIRSAEKVSLDRCVSLTTTEHMQLFFASNILLVLVHGSSRTCMLLTLARVQHRRTWATYVVSAVLGIWLVGSLLGVILNRLIGPTFWSPVGQDCSVS